MLKVKIYIIAEESGDSHSQNGDWRQEKWKKFM